ncbi:MAG: EAL domain-containing protein [Lachnospiraceae bacterium]|nr:EAL domain-containing protein [Lachnospiraceae bacterium]
MQIIDRVNYFDICSIFVLLAILISLLLRKMYRGGLNRAFIQLAILMILSCIFDILRALPYNENTAIGSSVVFRFVMGYIFCFLRALQMPLLIRLYGIMSGTWSRIKSDFRIGFFYFFPLIGYLILVYSNFFNQRIFHYILSADGISYVRGDLMPVYDYFGFYFMIFSLIQLFIIRKRLSVEKFLAMLLVYPVNVMAILIQDMYPQLMTGMFGASLSVLMLAFFVFRPDESIDLETGLSSYIPFENDIENLILSGRKGIVIFCKISNDSEIRSLTDIRVYRKILRSVADILVKERYRGLLSTSDFYYLRGGLYANILQGRFDRNIIKKQIDKLVERYCEGYSGAGYDVQLDMCICSVLVPDDIAGKEELMKFSERIQNLIEPWKPVQYSEISFDREFVILNSIDSIIEDAIRHNRFEMYYQPIYSLKDKTYKCAEALIRLNSEEFGSISPSVFIPAAERTGRIVHIGDFVIKDVCRFLSQHSPEELGVDYIEVNLSIIQCMQADMAVKIKKYMAEYNIDPNWINFEITETAADGAYERVLETMHEISAEGVRFSLDDYGSGYSNLHRVMSFPYKVIKLDKSLTDEAEDPEKRRILEEAIKLIKSMGARIVVEGVESKEISDWFEAQGCDFIQGFYYAKPMSEREYLDFMKVK